MKKFYAVIDTNVLVPAMLKWNSVPGSVMELAFDGPIVPVLNTDILMEYLVTGNIKHFPVRPFVVTPRQMLEIVLGSE